MVISDEVKERFWKKVEKSGEYKCWKWTGSKSKNGYGDMAVGDKRVMSAHRLSYLINVGNIPEGLYVIHICDHRDCVNPNHLRARSQKENVHDMLWKGRRKGAKKKVVVPTL